MKRKGFVWIVHPNYGCVRLTDGHLNFFFLDHTSYKWIILKIKNFLSFLGLFYMVWWSFTTHCLEEEEYKEGSKKKKRQEWNGKVGLEEGRPDNGLAKGEIEVNSLLVGSHLHQDEAHLLSVCPWPSRSADVSVDFVFIQRFQTKAACSRRSEVLLLWNYTESWRITQVPILNISYLMKIILLFCSW